MCWTVACIITSIKGRRDGNLVRYRLNYIYGTASAVGICFLVLTILLSVSIGLLIWRLKVKEKETNLSRSRNEFGKEIWNLIIILIFFSSSFLMRFIFDKYLAEILLSGSHHDDLCLDSNGILVLCYPYSHCFYTLVTQYFWDLIPIFALLLLHYYSFRTNSSNLETEPQSLESSQHYLNLEPGPMIVE